MSNPTNDPAPPAPSGQGSAAPAVAAPRLSLRISFPGGMILGPGKADLLEQIRATGSISAAGRTMGMSYKRAWMLVETMNAGFVRPLVESARGGVGGGGAQLTPTGEAVLGQYRSLTAAISADPRGEIAAIADLLARPPAEPAPGP